MEKPPSTIIAPYFPNLSTLQTQQFDQLQALYTSWNAKINVISRKDIKALYTRHVLHSLGIAKVLSFVPKAEILDIGTGGGFPGIPLAILFPDTQFVLVDSIDKKIRVVKAVAKALRLYNVKGIHTRAEHVEGQFDFIVSRAVTHMQPFYEWTKGKLKKASQHTLKNGILYLKGGNLTAELKEANLRYRIFELHDFFKEDFFETKKVVYVERQ